MGAVDPALVIRGATAVASVVGGILGNSKAKRRGVEAEISAVQQALEVLPREISKLKRARTDLIREIRKFPEGNDALRRTGLGGFLFFGKSKLDKAREKRDNLKAQLKELEDEALDLVDENENLTRLLVKLQEAAQVRAVLAQRQEVMQKEQRALQAGVDQNNVWLIGGSILLVGLIVGGRIIRSRQGMGTIEVR